MREAGKSKTCVWRWQERFAAEGVDGLLRDKTRPSRIPKLDPSVAERIVALTMEAPQRMGPVRQWPGGWRQRQFRAAHLARARAPAASGAAVQAVEGPGLRREAADIVGLYVDPPAHAVVLSVDEKSQIQALDRTQPGMPLKKGRAGTLTHDLYGDVAVKG